MKPCDATAHNGFLNTMGLQVLSWGMDSFILISFSAMRKSHLGVAAMFPMKGRDSTCDPGG